MSHSFRDRKSWRSKGGGKITPKVKWCIICHEHRVKHHHVYCDKCKEEENLMRKRQRKLIGL